MFLRTTAAVPGLAGLLLAGLLAGGPLLAGCGGDDSGDRPPPAAAAQPAATAHPVVVPRLVGREQGAAHRIVRRAGLRLSVNGYAGKYGNGRYEIGCVAVLSQSPAAGERLPAGGTVVVVEHECRTPRTGPTPPAGTE